MNDDYLWNGSGEPDPEVARLEKMLEQFRRQAPAKAPHSSRPASGPGRHWQRRVYAGIAAAVILLAVSGATVWRLLAPAHRELSQWSISTLNGRSERIALGQRIETDATHEAQMASAAVGELQIEPNSRLTLLADSGAGQQFRLERGIVHAVIWAPPRHFSIETPSATSIDLGCAYTLHVDKEGAGFLAVETGWVAFAWRGVDSFIPAGAVCKTNPRTGPGIPFFEDATERFRTAVEEFDRTGDPIALRELLSTARPRDGLTLWHLLSRTHGAEREATYQRLASLVKLPPAANKRAIRDGESAAMDAAWNALQLGSTDWWQGWKRPW